MVTRFKKQRANGIASSADSVATYTNVEKLPKRDGILRTAAALFRQYGYFGTSVRDIAKALGVPHSAIYGHFRSKESLCFEVVHASLSTMTDGLEALTARRDVAPVQMLAEAIRYHLMGIVEHVNGLSVMLNDTKHLAPRHRKQVNVLRDRYEGMFRRILERGVVNGTFRAVDARFTTFCILGMCNWVYNWYKDGQVPPQQIADIFCGLIMDGLRPVNVREASEEDVPLEDMLFGGR